MTTKHFADRILKMDNPEKRKMAIENLKNGLEKETRWNEQHKKEVRALIQFLESESSNIDDLISYIPNS